MILWDGAGGTIPPLAPRRPRVKLRETRLRVYTALISTRRYGRITAMTTTTASIYRLADVHPHHVERIKATVDANAVGSVVTYVGKGEGSFYTGVSNGTRAVVAEVHPTGSLSVVSAARPGAALVVYRNDVASDVERLPLVDWTAADIAAAKDIVKRHEQALMEQARHYADLGIDESALATLRESTEANRLAFALNVWQSYAEGRD